MRREVMPIVSASVSNIIPNPPTSISHVGVQGGPGRLDQR